MRSVKYGVDSVWCDSWVVPLIENANNVHVLNLECKKWSLHVTVVQQSSYLFGLTPFQKFQPSPLCLHIQQRNIDTTLSIISAVPFLHVMRASMAYYGPSRLSHFPSELSYKVWQCLIQSLQSI